MTVKNITFFLHNSRELYENTHILFSIIADTYQQQPRSLIPK